MATEVYTKTIFADVITPGTDINLVPPAGYVWVLIYGSFRVNAGGIVYIWDNRHGVVAVEVDASTPVHQQYWEGRLAIDSTVGIRLNAITAASSAMLTVYELVEA